MKNNKRNTGLQKDKLFMIAASVFILTAFTVTGVYVADRNKPEQDGYLIDFSELEQQTKNEGTENKVTNGADNAQKAKIEETPSTTVNSGKVENPTKKSVTNSVEANKNNQKMTKETESETKTEVIKKTESEKAVKEKTYTFTDTDSLAWPVVGNVLLNYSMDKAIYYQTMQQYRYNPAVVISAKEDEPITAAADGKVISVFRMQR